ncbi:acyl-CoA dehydrogenase [Marinobacter sp. CA1]|uniref:acyl-CoA dehydrogenase n=1 Tax=Marinobacter sp. CA1 TaxID=2817656 RepID=UPI001D07A6F4|nr:acyl-CoA dehydrogenase [Marinobacter sp. CA1]UDL05180.1 acyl-CoA dehydrogenase [Marinobacter sp. CA1]
MAEYRAPTRDMAFVLSDVAGFHDMAKACGHEEVGDDLVTAILDEAARFSGSVLAPLNGSGDRAGLSFGSDHTITTPAGFADAYRQYVDGGWGSLQFAPAFGGQGLPFSLAIPVQEMWHAANMAWGLCPLLSQGAVEALSENASEALKAELLPKMVSGQWTGTMNLTEPQAGSDLATIRTTAERDGAHYRIRGQKIFITWGEHDMAENIVHLVLARLPDAPAGVRGISLFAVPKYLPDAQGEPGERNDCHAVSIEHKLGIHASPTCVMSYGDNDGAIGYLVGEENQGLACMFTMMNNARLTVGLQGVAVADRAYQAARDYVFERQQGVAPGATGASAIIRHPDVRRMMMTMKALTEAGRCLAYSGCVGVDLARAPDLDEDQRRYHRRRVEVMTPLVKGWCTEMAQEVTSLAVQCHGGMGFVEETGVAQYYRDARILPIYEGTNGIQAMDLVGRKTLRDQGQGMTELVAEMRGFAEAIAGDAAVTGERLDRFRQSVAFVDEAVRLVLDGQDDANHAGSVAFNYLMLTATTVAAWLMLQSAQRAAARDDGSDPFLQGKRVTVNVFIDQILPRCAGYLSAIRAGSEAIMAMADDSF